MWQRIVLAFCLTLAAIVGLYFSLDLASIKSDYSLLGFIAALLIVIVYIKTGKLILRKYFTTPKVDKEAPTPTQNKQ